LQDSPLPLGGTDDPEGCGPLQVSFRTTGMFADNARYFWDVPLADLADPAHPLRPENFNKVNPPEPCNTPDCDPAQYQYAGIFHSNPTQTFNAREISGVTGHNPDVYNVLLQVDNGVCSDITWRTVRVYPSPEAVFEFVTDVAGGFCPFEDEDTGELSKVEFRNLSHGRANDAETEYYWRFQSPTGLIGITPPPKGNTANAGDPTSGDIVGYPYENLLSSAPLRYQPTLEAMNIIRNYICLTDADGNCVLDGGGNPIQIPNYIYCSSSMTLPLSINPGVKADFTGPVSGCSPANASFVNQSSGAITGTIWNFGDGSNEVSISNPSHTFVHNTTRNQDHIFNVTLTVSNALCSASISKPFRAHPQPTASFWIDPNQLQNACQPMNIDFHNRSNFDLAPGMENPTGTRYTWDFGDGFFREDPSGIVPYTYQNTSGSVILRYPTLTATTPAGCSYRSPAQTVSINPFLQASFTWEPDKDTYCSPLPIRFRNTSIGYESFTYNFGDGNSHSGLHSDSDAAMYVHTFTNESQWQDRSVENGNAFRVTLTVWTAGCPSTAEALIPVLAQPIADFRPGPPWPSDFFFPAPPVAIDNLIPPPASDNLIYLWSWRNLNAPDLPTNFSTQPYPPSLRLHEWGRHEITQHVTAPNRICTDRLTLPLRILAPAVRANFDDVQPACGPYEVQFYNTSRYGVRYLWDFGDGLTSTLQSPTHTFTEAGTYQVSLTAIGYDGDRDVMRKEVVVYPTPQPIFSVVPPRHYTGQTLGAFDYTPILFFNGVPLNPYEDLLYEWDWGDGSPIVNDRQPKHVYHRAGLYTVSLTISTKTDPICSFKSSIHPPIEIIATGDLLLPNVFRPLNPGGGGLLDGGGNGGGGAGDWWNVIDRDEWGAPSDVIPDGGYKNYLFFPGVMSETRRYNMTIFNRLGVKIFETNDPRRGWNGYYRGRICEEGVYTFKIEGIFATGESFSRIGDITLLW